jgi:hypothetical protein
VTNGPAGFIERAIALRNTTTGSVDWAAALTAWPMGAESSAGARESAVAVSCAWSVVRRCSLWS